MFGANPAQVSDPELEALRLAIIAEYDAISFYEQLAAQCEPGGEARRILIDIVGEEKIHVGELHAVLERLDLSQAMAMTEGKQEVERKTQAWETLRQKRSRPPIQFKKREDRRGYV